MKRDKKAVSPIVSTVLLILIVIILAVIILLWSRGFIKEKILKFDKPIDQVCGPDNVKIEPFVNDDQTTFGFTNTGNVPIYAVQLKLTKSGGSEVQRVDGTVDKGISKNLDGYKYGDYDKISIMPILLGKTSNGAVKEYLCPDSTAVAVK